MSNQLRPDHERMRPEDLPRTPWAATVTMAQLEALDDLVLMLRDMNRKINLVSRQDEPELNRIHIPHCLSLTLRAFGDGASVVDLGTGGGLPALPLAIADPALPIRAIDLVEKKVLAVRTMARRLGLANVSAVSGDARSLEGTWTHSVSRATAALSTLWSWHIRGAVPYHAAPGSWRGGLIAFKGGDLEEELEDLRAATGGRYQSPLRVEIMRLQEILDEAYFETKLLVHISTDLET